MGKKKRQGLSAEQKQAEAEAACALGKHVSKQKGRILLAATLAACALPILLGVRIWDAIPEIVPTGLLGPDGKDDSLPRVIVVFGMPGLMCLLNLIAHFQLLFNQKHMTMPSRHVRLVGRMGFPIISVLFCSGLMLQAANMGYPLTFVTPCILGLALLLLGAHMLDCPENARVSLRFALELGEAWKPMHDLAGKSWIVGGLLVIGGVMLGAGRIVTVIAALAVFIIPLLIARFR